MPVDADLLNVLAAAATGLAASVAIERLMSPAPGFARPWAAWAIHAGLWLCTHGLTTILIGRPWFAAATVTALLLVLVLVNNAKVKALREPFVFHDYEYFTDAIMHPRLYIPFLGLWNFIFAAVGVSLAVALGLWGEGAPDDRLFWGGQLGGVALTLGVGLMLLLAGRGVKLVVNFEPERDIRSLGLLASLWRYQEEANVRPALQSPFDAIVPAKATPELPHLLAIQSESFFDARALFSGIRKDVLQEFDRLKGEALAQGWLSVPAWGANTVRTEFSFLSGIDNAELGVHRFNPYRTIAGGWDVGALAAFLRHLGYRTLCIHPYPASFYRRNRVIPRLGFDEFLDLGAFDSSKRFGPYISDEAVAEKIAKILDQASGPVFVFAITMENHGPLHLESVSQRDIEELYDTPPPQDCQDLTAYLRHLRNADRMIAKLKQTLEHSTRPASLCWFGDHVPIMPSVYNRFGAPKGEIEYLLWSNQDKRKGEQLNLAAHDLAVRWLREMQLV